MTDKFKPVPNVPKTYEQFVLEEQQLTPEQGRNLYPDLSYEDIKSQEGYGPCSYCNPQCTCYASSGYAPLYMSCPSCENRRLMVWTHHDNNCCGPMYISEYLDIECKRCYQSGHWRGWKFSCSEHEGYKHATSFMSFKDAVRMGLGMQAGNSGLADLVLRISTRLIKEGRNQ